MQNFLSNKRIECENFFCASADELVVNLLGKALVRKIDGIESRYLIAETECYMGIKDTACHAFRGKTARTSTLWERGGMLYVYLIYGLHYMLNIVAGKKDEPMCVLIRGVKGIKGPGKLTNRLEINKDFNKEDLFTSNRIWIEDTGIVPKFNTTPRIGIDYANKPDIEKLWRFTAYEYL